MIENPCSDLWDKDFKEWIAKDYQQFQAMEQGILTAKKPKKRIHNAVSVMRVYDGKIYLSITDCRTENKLCKATILKMVREGILFKRVI